MFFGCESAVLRDEDLCYREWNKERIEGSDR